MAERSIRALAINLVAAAVLGMAGAQAQAINYYWDADGAVTTATGGTGTWDTTTQLWRSPLVTDPLTTWVNATTAIAFFGTTNGGTAGTVTIADGTTINLTQVFFQNSAGYELAATGSGALTFAAATITTTTSATISAPITSISAGGGSLPKLGAATLTLSGSNTYTGNTSISAGTVSVASLGNYGTGVASNLGTPTTEALGVINLGSNAGAGTLLYTGGGQTTNRYISLAHAAAAHNGGTLQNDGSGVLIFTHNFTSAVATGAGTKLLTLQGTNINDNEIQGAIINGDADSLTAVTKAQGGKWILSGPNAYTGATTVTAGTLLVNGSTAAGSIVTVNGGTLGGTGTINGATTVAAAAKIAPGTSAGTLNLAGGLTVNGTYDFEGGDLLNITGAMSLGGASALALTGALDGGTTYTIAQYTAGLTGTFLSVDAAILATHSVQYGPSAGAGSIMLTPIPEPASVALVALGSLLLIPRQRR
ncbi:MAG: autotransporter-associated beta strand repeat-containing protein [Phycisphaeraceae bacterium]